MAGVFYSLLLTSHSDPLTSIAFALLFSVSLFFFIVNSCHDVVHRTFVSSAFVNNLFESVFLSLLGPDGHMWAHRHLAKHHPYANVKGFDCDIDETVILRFSTWSQWLPFHKFQWLYFPLVYSILKVHSAFLRDPIYIFNLMKSQNFSQQLRTLVTFVIKKLYYVSVWILIPYFFLDFTIHEVLMAYFFCSAVLSFLFMPIGLSHLNSVSLQFEESNPESTPISWEQQVLSSLDWNPESHIASFFYGGLNCHVAHHLFPHLNHRHYDWITKIIREECERAGVSYQSTTFFGLWKSHVQFLRTMGQQPAQSTTGSNYQSLANQHA